MQPDINSPQTSIGSSQKSSPITTKASSNSGKRVCTSCGSSNTPLWRRNALRELVCNACGLYQKANNNKRPDWLKKRATSVTKTFPNMNDSAKIGGGHENMFFFQWNPTPADPSSSSHVSRTPFHPIQDQDRANSNAGKGLSCQQCGSRDENITWRKDSANRLICHDCFATTTSTVSSADSLFRHAHTHHRSASSDGTASRQSDVFDGLRLLHAASTTRSYGGVGKLAKASRDANHLLSLATTISNSLNKKIHHQRTRSYSPRSHATDGPADLDSTRFKLPPLYVPAAASTEYRLLHSPGTRPPSDLDDQKGLDTALATENATQSTSSKMSLSNLLN